MNFCCELFKVEFENDCFSREVREGKVYYTAYFHRNDLEMPEEYLMPEVAPINFCPFCGNRLQ